MIILASIVLYPLIGYLIFRGWVRVSPAQNGEYGTSGDYGPCMEEGWYVPAILKGPFAGGMQRGMDVTAVLWLSLCGWPMVLMMFGTVLAGRAIGRCVTRIAMAVTSVAIKPITKTVDPDIAAANREVEEICQ